LVSYWDKQGILLLNTFLITKSIIYPVQFFCSARPLLNKLLGQNRSEDGKKKNLGVDDWSSLAASGVEPRSQV
jgi:hypothetical protein